MWSQRNQFIKQNPYCVSLLRKTKIQYHANLNEKDVADNKNFSKTVKPLLSDKFRLNGKVTFAKDDKIFTQDKKVPQELNSVFSKVVKEIPEYSETNPLVEGWANPIIKSVLKYGKLPSFTTIRNLNLRSNFELSFVSVVSV